MRLTWGLKAASPGELFIEYLLFGCHHQRERKGRQDGGWGVGGSAPAACWKTWLRLLWAGTPTKLSLMEPAEA